MAKGNIVRVNVARHMVVTQIARLSFPALFTPKAFQDKPNEAKSFSCDLIFDSMDDLKKPWEGKKTQTPSLMKAIRFAKEDQWGVDPKKWPNFPHANIKKGDEQKNKDGEIRQGYEGKFFVKATSGEKFPPKIVLRDGTPATEAQVYGGCFVQAQILVRPYLTPNQGVSLRLVSIRKVKDGDKFGAGIDLLEYEDAVEAEDDDNDWTESGEDDEGI